MSRLPTTYRWVWAALLALLIGAPLLPPAAQAGALRSVAVAPAGSGATVAIEFEGSAGASAFALDGPKRIVVDLQGVTAATVGAASGGPVAKVRAAQFDAGTTRIVLDLAAPARIAAHGATPGGLSLTLEGIDDAAFQRFVAAGRTRLSATVAVARTEPQPAKPQTARPQDAKPPPVVAARTPPPQVKQPERTAVAALPPQVRSTPPQTKAPPPRAPQSQPPQARPRQRTGLPVVVIDAGHGGKDVGAISVIGNDKYEKDVVLAIAKAIKKELDASGRVRAVLTRSDDRYLRHRDRFEIARRNRAELFISVHADSAPTPQASGATVYTLSETASDAEAARLAAKENRSDIIAGVDLGGETSEVTDILIDLAQRETKNTSAEFAALLQRELRQDIKVRSQFHRFAGFLVLKAPDVPSVLLETGYLSNAEDAKFLFSEAGQARIARGVRRAVEGHFLRRIAQR